MLGCIIGKLTSTTQQRQEGREYRRDKEEMQSGVGTLGSLESRGRNAVWKSCEQIRAGGGKGTEEVKDGEWRGPRRDAPQLGDSKQWPYARFPHL